MKVLQAASVVVGAGVHGSSAALHLAQAGQDTILLEQFPLPHSRGSSHGQTRIIRIANRGIEPLTPIMADSFSMWKKLEQESGVPLLRPNPMLAVSNDKAELTGVAKTIVDGGYQPVSCKVSEVNRKYGMSFPPDCEAIIDPAAGVLMADKCVQTIQKLFRESGGRVVDEWPVEEVVVGPSGEVEVRGPKGCVRAARAVLCPGPWAGPMLAKLGVHLPLEVKRVSVFYWRLKDKTTPTISFVDHRIIGDNHMYGVPSVEYPGMVKVVNHSGPVIRSPEERDLVGSSREVREMTMGYVKDNLPCLEPVPVVEETCLYTVTPDEEFVVDSIPNHPNVIYACGFSGTGFKIAPAIGEDLCRLALGRPTVRDLSAFSASRFKPKSKM